MENFLCKHVIHFDEDGVCSGHIANVHHTLEEEPLTCLHSTTQIPCRSQIWQTTHHPLPLRAVPATIMAAEGRSHRRHHIELSEIIRVVGFKQDHISSCPRSLQLFCMIRESLSHSVAKNPRSMQMCNCRNESATELQVQRRLCQVNGIHLLAVAFEENLSECLDDFLTRLRQYSRGR